MKAKSIRAKIMFYDETFNFINEVDVSGYTAPVFVLPATREAYEQMVEQGARAMWLDDVGHRKTEPHWEQLVTEHPLNAIVETFRSRSAAMLAALGMKPPATQQPVKGEGRKQ